MTKSEDETDKEYEVGYKKPPRKHQFKKGRSGNPKGRPKGRKNFKTDVLETLKTPVAVSENGKRKKVSTQAAAILMLRDKALKGDQKAIDRLLTLAQAHNNDELEKDISAPLTEGDAEIIERAFKRQLRKEESQKTEAEKSEIEEEWKRSGLADSDEGEQWLN